ncbi:MAG TPA: fumarylacetoacetate hydrolase family protein [Bryobacteraceae bacterium]|jgi:2-keto-4-pentenoate hydratase/2-oxohepta-3-ene-1,7-dioic acid hydratase in catechol pathway|nr:fumarylacetoacetate hydrolase family protein [Bryobacteraceae bacterium]
MKFVTFQGASRAEAGVVLADRVVSLATAGFADMLAVLASGPEGRAKIDSFIANPPSGSTFPLASVRLLAPVPRPPKLICIGLNYRDHAAEARQEIPKVPTIFAKFSNVVIGPGEPIVIPRMSRKPDYEAEFMFVIGAGGRHIAAQDWQRHVFGYTVFNDVSARDIQSATSQWMIGKSFDTFAPMGPWLVSADEIPDPHALDISLSIGGEVLQHSNTRELIFPIPDLVAYLSSVVTLEPGDVVATGTPGGVGFARKPPRYLQPGDEVIVNIAGIGQLRNPVIAEA